MLTATFTMMQQARDMHGKFKVMNFRSDKSGRRLQSICSSYFVAARSFLTRCRSMKGTDRPKQSNDHNIAINNSLGGERVGSSVNVRIAPFLIGRVQQQQRKKRFTMQQFNKKMNEDVNGRAANEREQQHHHNSNQISQQIALSSSSQPHKL
jgi:hypothetical protein